MKHRVILYRIKRRAFDLIRPVLRRCGVEAFLRKEEHLYVPRLWGEPADEGVDIRKEPVFAEVAAAAIAGGRTLLYYDRLYTIFQGVRGALRLTTESQPLRMAEVGVFRGGTSHFIASTAAALGASGARMFCFDTFEGHAAEDVRTSQDGAHKPGYFHDTSYEAVRDYLAPLPGVKVLKGRVQDTSGEVANETFQFVHLDVDIYLPMLFSLEFFGERLSLGGAIVVDDCGTINCPGAKQAVDEFVESRAGFSKWHLLTGQCVLVRWS
jgi:O-methyltransferase